MCDLIYRNYLQVCGIERGNDNWYDEDVQDLILKAMAMFLVNQLTKDFSASHDKPVAVVV